MTSSTSHINNVQFHAASDPATVHHNPELIAVMRSKARNQGALFDMKKKVVFPHFLVAPVLLAGFAGSALAQDNTQVQRDPQGKICSVASPPSSRHRTAAGISTKLERLVFLWWIELQLQHGGHGALDQHIDHDSGLHHSGENRDHLPRRVPRLLLILRMCFRTETR